MNEHETQPQDSPGTGGQTWSAIESAVTSAADSSGVMSRLVLIAEIAETRGKRLLVVSSDAAGIRLKPWETEGMLVRGLIDNANADPRPSNEPR